MCSWWSVTPGCQQSFQFASSSCAISLAGLRLHSLWLCKHVDTENIGCSSPCRFTHLCWSILYFCVQSLEVKAGEAFQFLQRMRLAISYILNQNQKILVILIRTVNPDFLSHFEAQPHVSATLGSLLEPHFKAEEIDVDDISYNTLLADISSCFVPVSVMRIGLTKLKKSEANPEQYKQLFSCAALFFSKSL